MIIIKATATVVRQDGKLINRPGEYIAYQALRNVIILIAFEKYIYKQTRANQRFSWLSLAHWHQCERQCHKQKATCSDWTANGALYLLGRGRGRGEEGGRGEVLYIPCLGISAAVEDEVFGRFGGRGESFFPSVMVGFFLSCWTAARWTKAKRVLRYVCLCRSPYSWLVHLFRFCRRLPLSSTEKSDVVIS